MRKFFLLLKRWSSLETWVRKNGKFQHIVVCGVGNIYVNGIKLFIEK